MSKRLRSPGRPEQAVEQRPPEGEGIENRVRLKVDAAGRVLIPADMRASMGLSDGGTVLAWLDRGELHVVSTEVAAGQAQQMARSLIGGDARLAEELIADRREEARREAKNG
jgi:bifunctional DNA-binding transcriptional regulator/antitoxin component of YhaV-PrlF toxin-antitoxin module